MSHFNGIGQDLIMAELGMRLSLWQMPVKGIVRCCQTCNWLLSALSTLLERFCSDGVWNLAAHRVDQKHHQRILSIPPWALHLMRACQPKAKAYTCKMDKSSSEMWQPWQSWKAYMSLHDGCYECHSRLSCHKAGSAVCSVLCGVDRKSVV